MREVEVKIGLFSATDQRSAHIDLQPLITSYTSSPAAGKAVGSLLRSGLTELCSGYAPSKSARRFPTQIRPCAVSCTVLRNVHRLRYDPRSGGLSSSTTPSLGIRLPRFQ